MKSSRKKFPLIQYLGIYILMTIARFNMSAIANAMLFTTVGTTNY